MTELPGAFFRLVFARAAATIAFQMAGVAVGWHIYELTGKVLDLGYVGLVQFLPSVVLVLYAGHLADCSNRKMIAVLAQVAMALVLLVLATASAGEWITREVILGLMFLAGAARSFEFTAMQTLLPALVGREQLPRALALAGSARQAAVIAGPLLGGLLYLAGPPKVYFISSLLFLVSASVITLLPVRLQKSEKKRFSIKDFLAGIRFIRSQPVVLGAISLDLFAVLLGGVTALLPVYAKDVLHADSLGLGLLRASPAVGAMLASLFLARFPLVSGVGKMLFGAVLSFGATTIIFALSRWLPLSCLLLVILGGVDMISVVIRSTLVQLATPDEMRGRVSAVNAIFIGASNELGEFESGLTAAWFGLVPATLIGGIGSVLVAIVWRRLFPQLLRYDRLHTG